MTDDTLGWTRRAFMQATAGAALVTAAPPARAAHPPRTLAQAGGDGTAAAYVVARLRAHGASTLFGVPGATCDPVFAAAQRAGMPIVVTSSDLEAAYAADGWARVKGLGAVCVTYGVGALGLAPVIAGAYAERSPIVIVNGGPTAEDLRLQSELGTLFSHSSGRVVPPNYGHGERAERTYAGADFGVFRELCVHVARAIDASQVPDAVDNAIRAALEHKRPVYIEIPKNVWDAKVRAPTGSLASPPIDAPPGDEDAALAQGIVSVLRGAKRPVVLVGVEVRRHGLVTTVTKIVETLGLPWASTLLAKSALPESTRGFLGVYAGANGNDDVREAVESADALLAIGVVMGRQYRTLVTTSASAKANKLMRIAHLDARFGVNGPATAPLDRVVRALGSAATKMESRVDPFKRAKPSYTRGVESGPTKASAGEGGLTYDEAIQAVSDFVSADERFVVVSDTSLSMYPAADIAVKGADAYVCNGVWQAIGFSVAAAVGVGLAHTRRPLVICGDGGFQMTAPAISTMARHRIKSVVLVLDNGHYGIEQFLLDRSYFTNAANTVRPYLALPSWDYVALAKAWGAPFARRVETRADLDAALKAAGDANGPALLSVRIRAHDLPSAVRA